MIIVSHCCSWRSGSGSAADPTRAVSSATSSPGPLGEQPDDGVERIRLQLLGGQPAEEVGHAGVGGLDGPLHRGVGHQRAERGRVQIAVEELLVADPRLDGRPSRA